MTAKHPVYENLTSNHLPTFSFWGTIWTRSNSIEDDWSNKTTLLCLCVLTPLSSLKSPMRHTITEISQLFVCLCFSGHVAPRKHWACKSIRKHAFHFQARRSHTGLLQHYKTLRGLLFCETSQQAVVHLVVNRNVPASSSNMGNGGDLHIVQRSPKCSTIIPLFKLFSHSLPFYYDITTEGNIKFSAQFVPDLEYTWHASETLWANRLK